MVPEQLRFECFSGDKSPGKDESVGPDGTGSAVLDCNWEQNWIAQGELEGSIGLGKGEKI